MNITDKILPITDRFVHYSLTLVLICFFLYSCIPKDRIESRFIKIANNSNQDLIFLLSEKGEFNRPVYDEQILFLNTNTSDSLLCSESYFSWEDMMKESDNKKLNIYIVKKNSLNKYGEQIDSIFKNHEFYRKCSFDIEFIEKNNWRIVFK